MGKQSARLFYEGQDCYDIVYDGSNLSKMNFNGDMLWERLPPQFILCDGNLHTSEMMKAISTFNYPFLDSLGLRPTESLETGQYIKGLEYINGYYYILYVFSTLEYAVKKYRRWLLKSENGYDWTKILDFEEEKTHVLGMKKYQNELIFSTESLNEQAYIGLFLMNADWEIEEIFNAKEIEPNAKSINRLIIGDNIIICNDFVLKNKSYAGTIKESLKGIVYDKKEKYFYGIAPMSGSLSNIFRSKDGLNWTRFFYINMNTNAKNIEKILFSDGYIYLIDTENAVYRTKNGTNIEKKELILEGYAAIHYFCVDDYFYFTIIRNGKSETYKTEDFFEVQETDEDFINAEKVKTAFIGMSELEYACCTDNDVEIYL